MALKLNGKDDRLTRQDFLTLARTIGLTAAGADAAIVENRRATCRARRDAAAAFVRGYVQGGKDPARQGRRPRL